jgi:GT2 family glycosyltransferase
MLQACIRSLKRSFTVDAQIVVVLNEGDDESVRVLMAENLQFVRLDRNHGTMAIDFASHLFRSEYIANVNDDMLFHPGWDADLIDIVERYYPASASCHLVEPVASGNPVVVVDDLGPFEQAHDAFVERQRAGRYATVPRISHTHPIVVRASDYFRIGGYSDLFDPRWFPGYCLDNYFCWRLWRHLGSSYRPITSGTSCVYHGGSVTMKKLPLADRQRDTWSYFVQKTGMTVEQFKAAIGYDQPLAPLMATKSDGAGARA